MIRTRGDHTQGCSLQILKCWLFIFLLCMGHLFTEEKKTLLVLSSTGGGGHIAGCNTLEQLVGDTYTLKVVYPINELKIWGVPTGENFYNWMLKRGWIRPMNFLVRHVVPRIFRSYHGKMEQIVAAHIQENAPALVVSLIPFVNYPASEAARKSHLPFLLITTDNDLRNWALDLDRAKHPHMKITIGEDLPHTKELLLQKQIPAEAIETIGLPLRSEFRNEKDREQICKMFDLPLEKKKVLIVMGGAGSVMAYEYAKRISKMPLGINLIVVAGHNEELKQDLQEMEIDISNLLSVCGYTDRIADLMAISDLIITKPGPGTINEAMAMQLPILIDNTNISLFWERANVDLVLKYGVGEKIRHIEQLEDLLAQYLQVESAPVFLNVPANQFHLRIPDLIAEMISLPVTADAIQPAL